MSERVPLNPVEQRLMVLADHWVAFREDKNKRLLVWLANDNALRIFQSFFEAQKYEAIYSLKDIFLVFTVPFDNAVQYSRELKQALAGQYDASRDDLKKQGIQPDWRFAPEELPDSARGFVSSLQSFGAHHHKYVGHLAAVFMPSEIADKIGFAAWLERAVSSGFPQRLRLVVIDSSEHPRLKNLYASPHQFIQVDAPDIDGFATAQETFAQEGAVGPAGVFRNLLMGLMTLVEKGTIDQVLVKAEDALAFARREKWADQEVAVKLMTAGAFLKAGRFTEAVGQYQSARETADAAWEQGHPAGRKMALQTWFGEAGAHLAAENLKAAVKCYDQAAVAAQGIPDLILGIEAFRMGAYCLSGMQLIHPAVRRNWNALALGERLKPDARPMTTLPLAALDLLRSIDAERVEAMLFITQQGGRRTAAARQKAAQSAADLEQRGGVEDFKLIEADLVETKDLVKRATIYKIDALAAGGNLPFRKAFGKGRELLGDGWPVEPLTTLAAAAKEQAS